MKGIDWQHYAWKILFTIAASWILIYLVRKLVHLVLKYLPFLDDKKRETAESHFGSVLQWVGLLVVLAEAAQPFAPVTGKLIAGTGIGVGALSLIVGVGSQSIIKDIIIGAFRLYENDVLKGDLVTLNRDVTGTVELLGMRTIKLREWSGKLHIISHSEVRQIENHSREKMRVVEKIVASFRENPESVLGALQEACDRLNERFPHFLLLDVDGIPEQPWTVQGITALSVQNIGHEYGIASLVNDDDFYNASIETRMEIAKTLFEKGIHLSEQLTFHEMSTLM